MKRYLFLSIVLFGSIVQAYSVGDLEKAIQDSRLEHVRVILPKLQLSERDTIRFVHLAHDVLCFRRNNLEIATMGRTRMENDEAIMALFGMACFITGGIIAVSDIAMNDDITKQSLYGFSLSFGSLIAIVCGTIYGHMKKTKRLNKQYCNALKIKHLIMNHESDGTEKIYLS